MKPLAILSFCFLISIRIFSQQSFVCSYAEGSGTGGSLSAGVWHMLNVESEGGQLADAVITSYEFLQNEVWNGILLEQTFISLYPNPARELIHVSLEGEPTGGKMNFEILNLNGSLLRNGQIQENQFTLSLKNLPPSMYLLRFSNGSAGNAVILRFVKE